MRTISALLLVTTILLASFSAEAAGDRHTVFDLVANRAHAHLIRGGGPAVDAGAWSFPRYANGNVRNRRWRMNQTVDGVSTAIAKTREVWLFVPVDAAEVGQLARLRMQVQPARSGAPLTVSINGHKLETKTLTSGWQTVTWSLSPKLVAAGEVRIDIDFGRMGRVGGKKGSGALAWLSFDDGSATTPPDLALGSDKGLPLATDAALAWYVFVPEKASVDVRFEGGGAGCTPQLRLSGPGGEVKASGNSLQPGALAGDVARLDVRASGSCDGLRIVGGGLTLPGPTPSFTRAAAKPKRVVLYLLDTLRADRLKTWNPSSRVLTPTLDRLSREGTSFLQAYAQGNESFVSHAAIFTGQYPRTSGIYTGGKKLRAEHLLMSEAIQGAGMATAGYTSNGYIDVRNGYLQGWDRYVNALIQKRPYKAPGLWKQAIDWVEGRGPDASYFLYVGPVDPHVSYRAHSDILPTYYPGDYSGRFRKVCSGDELGRIKGGSIRVDADDKRRIEALYDNEVDFSDRYLAKFLAFLEERGELDETMIVVASDHGDEFWEHGSCGHGHSVYDELVHVPIIVRYPPLFPKGELVSEGVDTIDLFPTILDAIGAEIPDGVQGHSLLPLANGEGRGYPQPSLASRDAYLYGVRLGRYKMILKERERRLYDLASDPREQDDVASKRAFATRWLADVSGLLVGYEKTWNKRRMGTASNLTGVR